MTHFETLTLENGQSIEIEIEEPFFDSGEQLVSSDIEKVAVPFKDAISKVKPLANELIGALTGLSQQPDEVAVRFGLKVNAEAGVIVAKTATEAHFEIELKWEKSG